MKHKLLLALFAPLLITGSLQAQCTALTPTASNAAINCGSSATLTASGAVGYQWWDQATGGTLLGSSATYTTPALTNNTSYYVEGTDLTPQAMMGLPAHNSPFTGNVRGYYFTAPVDFIITGLKIPAEVSGNQSIAVMSFPATPPLYSTVTNTFTLLYLTQNNPATGIISVNIPVTAGTIIGILGQAGTSNSYGTAGFSTTIAGQPVTLNRLGMQFPLTTTAPQDLWTENGGSISRVEMYYQVMCVSAPRVQVDVNVTPIPVSATAVNSTICAGASTTLNATGATTYTWMPGNLTGSSVTVSPTATETYTVTGSDPSGCTNTSMVTVTVNTPPTVVANATATTVCAGDPVTLTGSGASTYTWTGGVIDAVAFNPTITDTYTVTGTDANGCTSNDMITVNVNALPTVVANATATTICAGDAVTFTGSGATSYTWAAAIAVTDNIPVNPTATDTYTVTGTDANGCMNTDMITVTANPLPTVAANSTASSVCMGDSITLTGSGALNYMWSGSVVDGVTFLPTVTDTYTVTGTDANGCSNTDMITVTVNALPTVVANSTAAAVCAGSPVTLTGSGAATYTWTGSVTDGVAFNPATTDTYTVTGTDANGCMNTDMITVTVNPLPTVTGSATSTTVCVDDASVALTGTPAGGTWSGTGVTGTSFSPTAAGVGPEVVTYNYTDANGCDNSATVTIQVNACVGVTEQAFANSVSIYPNPNNGVFTVAVNANVGDAVIVITDMQGRVVYSSIENNVQSGYTKQISLEKEAAGLYFVSITANGEQRTEKISVQK